MEHADQQQVWAPAFPRGAGGAPNEVRAQFWCQVPVSPVPNPSSSRCPMSPIPSPQKVYAKCPVLVWAQFPSWEPKTLNFREKTQNSASQTGWVLPRLKPVFQLIISSIWAQVRGSWQERRRKERSPLLQGPTSGRQHGSCPESSKPQPRCCGGHGKFQSGYCQACSVRFAPVWGR